VLREVASLVVLSKAQDATAVELATWMFEIRLCVPHLLPKLGDSTTS